MSRERIYVPVQPHQGIRSAVNQVMVTTEYHKGRGIVVAAHPVERKPDGIELIAVTATRFATAEMASRLNTKRVDACRQRAFQEVENRVGSAWDLVLTVCNDSGLTPL